VREHDGRIANASCQHNGEQVVWSDLAQFDHPHTRDPEGLYRYCVRVVEHLLALGFDGFRCDAAYQIPQPVWQRLIREVKSRHPSGAVRGRNAWLHARPDSRDGPGGF